VTGALFVYASDLALPDADLTVTNITNEEGQNEAERKVVEKKTKAKAARGLSPSPKKSKKVKSQSHRRIILLLVAVVLHNFPEGLAVGVAFGGIGSVKSATFERARTIAIGIGLQNFPEGLAVSLPLRRLGWSNRKAFFYGQLSGMVEPLGGILGAGAVQFAQPMLPYALSFAAGAMIYVVVDSVSPESHERKNGALASWGCMVGFIVMMSLDVALG
jgi:zinc transporter 11